ncbi:hypothetical protein CYANOKiyG1_32410 [Okeania sp. KiyG1]|nr:AAA family ATPase [Okeania sp. KiyG1]GGA18094.1 hypothetical protein CYANOKiyG1_32410 [Okeania sp. KiyG1]
MPAGWERKTTTNANTEEIKSTNQNKSPEQTPNNNSSDKTTEINRMEMFIPEEPQKSLDNLILPSTVKNRIDTALNRIKYHDILYHQWNLKSIDPRGKRTAINLFGLPGTGKTFCAEAIAHFLEKKLSKLTMQKLSLNMWVKRQKILRQLLTRRKKPIQFYSLMKLTLSWEKD